MNFRYSKKSWHFSNQLCKVYSKKKKLGQSSKIELSSNFFYFFIFFSVNFFSFRNIKIWLQILKDSTRYTPCKYQQIRAISSNGGPGGRLAPPASKCHKKKCEYVGHGHWHSLCRLGISINSGSEIDKPHGSRKPHQKNKKFPRYPKNPKNQKSSEKNENHALGYSKNQQLKKNNEKFFGRMREILGAYRKKPITQKSVLWNFEIKISEWCIN